MKQAFAQFVCMGLLPVYVTYCERKLILYFTETISKRVDTSSVHA